MRIMFVLKLLMVLCVRLSEVLKLLLRFLLTLNIRQVVLLELREDWLEFIRSWKVEIINVIIFGYIDQIKKHELLKASVPFFVGDPCMNMPPFILVLLASACHLSVTTWDLGQERELHLDTLVNLLVVLEDYIIVEVRVGLMTHYPVPLQVWLPLINSILALSYELFRRELQQKFLVRLEAQKWVLVLVNFTANLADLYV